MTIININKIYLTIIWLHLVIFKTQKTFISPNLQAYSNKYGWDTLFLTSKSFKISSNFRFYLVILINFLTHLIIFKLVIETNQKT